MTEVSTLLVPAGTERKAPAPAGATPVPVVSLEGEQVPGADQPSEDAPSPAPTLLQAPRPYKPHNEPEVFVARKSFKLNGKRVAIGTEFSTADIPRPDSWVSAGYLKRKAV